MRHPLTALAACAALAAAAAPALATDYTIDPVHTSVFFEISHFGASVNRARFDDKKGTVQFDPAAKTGRVEITFETDSVDSGSDAFDEHLESADIFDAKKYPTIRFVGDKFVFDGDKVKEVTGQLTFKGQTHPVTFKARQFNCYQNPMLKREVCGGDFEAVIDRTQWSVDYLVKMGMPTQVRLVATVEAVRD